MRAQTASEFALVLFGLVFVFIIFALIFFGQEINLQQSKDKIESYDTIRGISIALNYVFINGDGTSYKIFIFAPRTNISINKGYIIGETFPSGDFSQIKLYTDNINTTYVKNMGEIYIKNKGGRIEIN